MNPEEFQEIRSGIPSEPGIYRYYDKSDQILYIGKAKDLRKRVSSYFVSRKYDSARIKLLVKRIARIEYTVVDSEKDALLLENNLIKKHQPKYNVQLKDDKSYPYIVIRKERFPRVYLMRNVQKDGSEYLGPYTSVRKVRVILDLIKQLFPIRDCTLNLSEANIEAGKFKVCLQYHIGNCLGPCEARQSEDDYNESVHSIRKILKGQVSSVIQDLNKRMESAVEELEFEKAEKIKHRIGLLKDYQSKTVIVKLNRRELDVFGAIDNKEWFYVNYMKVSEGAIVRTKSYYLQRKLEESKEELLQIAVERAAEEFGLAEEIVLPYQIEAEIEGVQKNIPKTGDRMKLVELAEKNAFFSLKEQSTRAASRVSSQQVRILTKLQEDLAMETFPDHIECFDNSNIQGTNPVASCVVFRNGQPAKNDYRKFNIKTVEGPDDFASMSEIVERRYKRLLEEEIPLPKLIVIDGGKGQLNAAVKSLKELGIYEDVVVIGIAKRLEEIYYPNDPYPLHIDKRSESLKLIQRIRNEAHRFAITFHRQKRVKGNLASQLDEIKGIGPKTADQLLKKYRSLKKIREVPESELAELIGKQKARLLIEGLKEDAS